MFVVCGGQSYVIIFPLQPDVKPDVAGGSEHINLKVTGSVSQLQS